MSIRESIAWLGTGVLLLAALPNSFAVEAAEKPDSEQVSKMLSETRVLAFQVSEDASNMESFTRTDASWESHAIAVTKIKEDVNALGRQAAKLKAARSTGSAWQQTAIDRIEPYLGELEGYTSAIIEHLDKDPKLIRTPEYKDYLEANADYAEDLATTINNFVDYGRTKERLQQLTDKLEVPAR